jgi:predicted RNase H-like nuclease
MLEPTLNFVNIPHNNQRSSAFIRGSNIPEIPTSFAPIKALENQRDALLYAYIRRHLWYWE